MSASGASIYGSNMSSVREFFVSLYRLLYAVYVCPFRAVSKVLELDVVEKRDYIFTHKKEI